MDVSDTVATRQLCEFLKTRGTLGATRAARKPCVTKSASGPTGDIARLRQYKRSSSEPHISSGQHDLREGPDQAGN